MRFTSFSESENVLTISQGKSFHKCYFIESPGSFREEKHKKTVKEVRKMTIRNYLILPSSCLDVILNNN